MPTDRITIIDAIHYEQEDEQPVSFERTLCLKTLTTDQPLSRRLKATNEWTSLDAGWIEAPGMIRITNDEGLWLESQPTEAELAEMASRKLLLRFGQDSAVVTIHPQDFVRFCVEDLSKIEIMTPSDVRVRFTLTVFTK